MSSSVTTIVVAGLVVLAVLALVVVLAAGLRDRRSQRLRSRFGPEYDRELEATGSRQEAEQALRERVDRRRRLQVHELDPAVRDRHAEAWTAIQARFVDDPRGAVRAADELVTVVMRDRGYPTGDFEQQAADASVDHAGVVPSYR